MVYIFDSIDLNVQCLKTVEYYAPNEIKYATHDQTIESVL